jgi:hypothetical protein
MEVKGKRLYFLLSFGTRILIATCISEQYEDLPHMTIWEVEKTKKDSNYMVLGFKYQSGDEVLLYNLSDNSWSWLPRCSINDDYITTPFEATTIFSFKPRVDMLVYMQDLVSLQQAFHAFYCQPFKHFRILVPLVQ